VAQWTAEQWQRISAHLDRALDLEEPAREGWITELERADAELGQQLRNLLVAHAVNNAAAFLERSPLNPAGTAGEEFADNRSQMIGRQFGSYRVLSLLGHGGMGSVWLAERVDGLFTRRVALKLIHPALVSQLMTGRFSREREILASLDHPNITRLIDAGFAADDQPYLALEYVAGRPIVDYCDECRLSVRERLELLRQVLGAVQYAHAHLVIHRDLKPSNILVTPDGQAHLLDFGIAKLLTEGEAKETELTRVGGRALTPDYAAPEQITGAPITTAADVYALGVMLYEMLTGERPYRLKRDSRGALEEAILQVDPVVPSRVTLSVPTASARSATPIRLARILKGDLDTIVIKSLKKRPAERYATANAFSEDIGRYLQGDVVLAQRDSAAYRAMKFVRRFRVAIAAAGILILTLAGGLAATSYEAKVASDQRDAALQAQLRSLTQTAAARLKDGDVPGALGIILEVLPHRGVSASYNPDALSVFQEGRASDAQILAITGHTDRVRSAAFSPDGRRVVTASFDDSARIWDANTGQQIILLSGHTDHLTSASFSSDNRLVVTASVDRTARVWDAQTGHEIVRLTGHAGPVRAAEFSPDARFLVTASFDGTARVWDVATGREILRLVGHTDHVNSAAFSPDGQRIVTASSDGTAGIWEAATGREIRVLSGHADRVSSAAFSPDSALIVTASGDGTARIWEVATGRNLVLLGGHTDQVTSARFSPDGHHVITASFDKTARIWDVATGRETSLFRGHTDAVFSAVYSPDGRRIMTAADDRTARIWDADGRALARFSGHAGRLPSAAFSSDGRQIVTSSFDRTARVWDAVSTREIAVMRGHTDRVYSAAFSPDGRDVVTASTDKTVRLWDAATGREISRVGEQPAEVFGVSFSPDAARIATASRDSTARIWDAASGRELTRFLGHTGPVWTAQFSGDGRRLITASDDKTSRIWDTGTGRELVRLSGHSDRVLSAVFSPDGRHAATSSLDQTARIWDAQTGRQELIIEGHADQVPTVSFSPDGRRVVTASDDKTARIWDAATGLQLKVLMHPDLVETATFSPDGDRVLTACDDGVARVWDAHAVAVDAQIQWAEAAQFDPLPSVARYKLGLPASSDVHRWRTDRSKCDDSAAAPYDPDRTAPGALSGQIEADAAVAACTDERGNHALAGRADYQRGRAHMASGDLPAAKVDFERAVAAQYRTAAIDLGLLISTSANGMLNAARAIELFERAWKNGVSIAAFELGTLYEHGVKRAGSQNDYAIASDESRAWIWYRQGAEAGEPNALARYAEKAESEAGTLEGAERTNSRLLEAFKYYAAAADRARREDWPDDAWRIWRYRRASLARLLAREGMMREVADAYDGVRRKYSDRRSLR
jgi:WD40 repeat protein/tRNA A-37 threonylcarbamoyl transferase component Bud32